MSIKIADKWDQIKVLIESLDTDVIKNCNGNASAGLRVRRGLRLLKKEAAELVKISLEKDKNKN